MVRRKPVEEALAGVPKMGMILLKSACPRAMTISPTKESRKRGMAISALRPKAYRFFVQINALKKKKGVNTYMWGAVSKNAV